MIEDEGGLRKKRWGAAALAFRDEDLLVIGGRGKWASNTVEVLCGCAWRLAKQGLQGHDKRYTACLVTRPSDRWTCPQWRFISRCTFAWLHTALNEFQMPHCILYRRFSIGRKYSICQMNRQILGSILSSVDSKKCWKIW